ncbi:hypothetical protein [Accumulibacter sp.]|uniref:hypothetical protein n=1 Tax=Accumulibacter sp. TaxID=2053492 RepID=UPI00258B9CDF|nr:hypothetical protein [Accumulibacter sp.]
MDHKATILRMMFFFFVVGMTPLFVGCDDTAKKIQDAYQHGVKNGRDENALERERILRDKEVRLKLGELDRDIAMAREKNEHERASKMIDQAGGVLPWLLGGMTLLGGLWLFLHYAVVLKKTPRATPLPYWPGPAAQPPLLEIPFTSHHVVPPSGQSARPRTVPLITRTK